MDSTVRQWQNNLTNHFQINQNVINTTLFADDQAIIPETEKDLQHALHKLNIICKEYNLKISTVKTKVRHLKEVSMLQQK
jgi:hypothetical protein